MAEQLIIKLPEVDSEPCFWLVIDENQQPVQGPGYNLLGSLTEVAKDRQLTVIIPSTDHSLLHTQLPTTQLRQLQQAIPYALEETLAEDVSNLHFSIRAHKQAQDVIVVSKSTMEKKLQQLTDAGLQAHKMLSELDLLATPARQTSTLTTSTAASFAASLEQWQIILAANAAHILMGNANALSCDPENLDNLLNIALSQAAETPQTIEYKIYSADYAQVKANAAATDDAATTENTAAGSAAVGNGVYIDISAEIDANITTKKTIINHSLIIDLAKAINSDSINILQGPYQSKLKRSPRKRLWTIASGTAVIWLTILFLGSIGKLFYLHSIEKQQQQNIAQLYRAVFPQAKQVSSPKRRIEKELQRLQRAQLQTGFLSLLAKAGEAIKKASNSKLTGLSYQSQELSVSIEANNFHSLNELISMLRSNGLVVKQTGASSSGKIVTAQLQLREEDRK